MTPRCTPGLGRSNSARSWPRIPNCSKPSATRTTPDASTILAKYAGIYREQDLWGVGPHPRIIEITVSDGTLTAELKSRGKTQLVAQSESRFSGFFGLGIDFVRDGQGMPTHLLEMHVSGNYRFQREK